MVSFIFYFLKMRMIVNDIVPLISYPKYKGSTIYIGSST